MTTLPQAIDFAATPVELARTLIGATLLVDGVGGLIVEVEAYDAYDPASHSYGGATKRNAAMFGPVGHAYVYRSYGVHWCFNIVCGPQGGAVLVRALEPTSGIAVMRERRGVTSIRRLCAGPGRLCQALGVSIGHNGLSLSSPPFGLLPRARVPSVVAGPRVGISRAVEQPWRFTLSGSRFLSRPARAP
jgi:DNA-3-methyladenine glycosylase